MTILFTDVADSTALGERHRARGGQARDAAVLRVGLGRRRAPWRHGREVHRRCRDGGVRRSDGPRGPRGAGGAGGARAPGGAGAAEPRAAAPLGRPDRDPHGCQQRRGRGRRRVRGPGARHGRPRQRGGAPAAERGGGRDPDRRGHPPARRRCRRGRGGRAALGARQGGAAGGLAAGRHARARRAANLGPLLGREPRAAPAARGLRARGLRAQPPARRPGGPGRHREDAARARGRRHPLRARHRARRTAASPTARGSRSGRWPRSCASWPATRIRSPRSRRALAGDPRAGVLADRVLQAAGLEEATAAREDLTRRGARPVRGAGARAAGRARARGPALGRAGAARPDRAPARAHDAVPR